MSCLFNDLIHYTKSFDVYLKRSTQQIAHFKIIENNLLSVLERTWNFNQFPDVFNVLDVGCGDGTGGDFLIFENIEKISPVSSKKPILFLQAVEPRADSLASFQASAESWAKQNSEIDLCVQCFDGSWEEYRSKTKQHPTKFHLINFIQSLYFLGVEDTLRDCITNHLADRGVIFCLIANCNCPMIRFQKAFNIPILTSHTSSDVVSIARKNGWRYDCFDVPYKIDITGVFNKSNMEGNLLLDFISHKKHYRMETNQLEMEQVEKYLLNDSEVDDDGKRKLVGLISAVTIYKS